MSHLAKISNSLLSSSSPDARLVACIKLYQRQGVRLSEKEEESLHAPLGGPNQNNENATLPIFVKEIPFMNPLLTAYDKTIGNLNQAVNPQFSVLLPGQTTGEAFCGDPDQAGHRSAGERPDSDRAREKEPVRFFAC